MSSQLEARRLLPLDDRRLPILGRSGSTGMMSGSRIRLLCAVAFGLVGVVLVASGCGGGTKRGRAAETQLTLLAVNPNVGRAAFHLSCRPAGGDVRDPARACAALAHMPSLIEAPKPFICVGGTSSWWDITISGRLNGQPVRHVSTCWTPQMALIGRFGIAANLEKHLLPRRKEQLFGGEERTFPAGLRPGDEVVCQVRGRKLEGGVPLNFNGGGAEIGYDGVGIGPTNLTITRHRDGSVSASCS